ncbi:F-box protein [Thalictrum thalictroides]|uniref:F-box protein n=1 Tax=Thalictrum thalictroides TaxID=46969 RepID=A0A7J6WX57_THATH|nr:F-box protein [Thalictrum thalictroides]
MGVDDHRDIVKAANQVTVSIQAKVFHLPFPNSWLNYYNVVAICNGLICLTDAYFNIHIWNPSIQEYITIPPHFTTGKSDAVFGFGFHDGINEYKVIRIVSPCQKKSELSLGFQSHVSVYTLGTNSWRILPDCLYGMKYFYDPSVLVYGALHWLASTTLGSNLIVSFDMKDEFFQEIPLPKGINSYHYHAPSVKLSGMGGYLSLSYSVHNYNVHIWQMKEYGVAESWTLQHVIGQTEVPGSFSWLFLVGAVNDGEIILTKSLREIILYNPKTNSVRNLYDSQILLADAYTYVGSLVSPKAIDGRRNVIDTKEVAM